LPIFAGVFVRLPDLSDFRGAMELDVALGERVALVVSEAAAQEMHDDHKEN
jgi:hypothetical protein